SGPVVDPDIGEATERAGQRQASGVHDRIHEVLQGLAEERGGRLLLESLLERARSDETKPAHEDRSQRRERERLAREEALDPREHQPERGAVPLSRVVSGARAQLVDHTRRERPPHLLLDGLRLRTRLWTGRCGLGSSRLHRVPLVGGLATEPTMSGPDLFPLSRYVTRKGSGHAGIAPSIPAWTTGMSGLGWRDKRVARMEVRGSMDRSPHLHGYKPARDGGTRGDRWIQVRGSIERSARVPGSRARRDARKE